jgi:hypothetical protein
LSGGGLLTDPIPNTFDDLLVVQTLEYSVAPNQEKVKVVLQFERYNFGVTNDHIRVSSISRAFRFDVSKGSRHRQSAWEDS